MGNGKRKASVNLLGMLPRFVYAKDSAVGRAQVLKADEKVSALVQAMFASSLVQLAMIVG